MIYLDTNVIVSYVDELDSKHPDALELLSLLEGEKVASRLTLLELVSVFSRAGLDDPVALALYSIEEVGVRIEDIDFNIVVSKAVRLARDLKLKTLDLLHLAACAETGSEIFATFDEAILKRAEDIRRLLGVRVIGGPWRTR
ncbi:MAG: PIN domain-containing protein [Thermofilum sp.]